MAGDAAAIFLCAFDKLEDYGKAVLFDRQPLDRMVRCRTVAKVLSMGGSSFVSASSARQGSRRVVERQQRIAVLGQAIGSCLYLIW
jgi:hypothetical protein